MTEVHLIGKGEGLRVVASHVMEESRDWRFGGNAILSQEDIIFQICANSQLKLASRVAFNFEV